jgi:enolase
MAKGSIVKSVFAREIYSDRGHPGVEATIITEDGSVGIAVTTAGVSVGEHEVQFVYDGGERWAGRGVQKAVDNVNKIIGPALMGVDASRQWNIDEIIIQLDGTPNKSKLGGNATGSASAAALKAGAASLEIPLYQHIGGTNACILPTPGVLAFMGSCRYGHGEKSGGKPSYSLMTYGYKTFAEASYACWQVRKAFMKLLNDKFGLRFLGSGWALIHAGYVKSDRELWDMMVEAINKSGNQGKIGIQVDVAAGTYYNKKKDVFEGLFSPEDKTKDGLMQLYHDMVKNYPFIILEDPLDEEDYEGHAELTRELGIQVVGDDLFTTNVDRLKQGMAVGAGNTVLLKVNQIGTISEAFETVQLAYSKGYGVMPCSSRGEGADIADYAVGLGTGNIRESGLDETTNRLMQIEKELGTRAKFLGKAGFKSGPARF